MRRRLCRLVRVRGRWRPCVVVMTYYVLTVLLIENLIIAVMHRRAPLADVDECNSSRLTVQPLVAAEHAPSSTVRTSTLSATTHLFTSRSTSPHQRPLPLRLPVSSSTTLPLAEQERLFYRRRALPVNRYRHRVVLEPSRLCPPGTRMVVLVHSFHTYTDRRAAIRSTWGAAVRSGAWPHEGRNASVAGLRLAFVLGLHRDPGLNDLVREELARHDDVIQGDFVDSYQNMTLKSLFDLKVVDERCPGVNYLLKTDDDMIVNLPYLLELLDGAHANLSRSIMGPLNVGSRVYRNGKWKLTKTEFPFQYFPPYESGSAYVITGDLVHELLVTSEYVPHIFIDDVYITGILGRIIGVNHVRQRGFAFWTDRPPNACDLVNRRVVSGTKMSPKNLQNLWTQLKLNPNCPDLPTEKPSTRKPVIAQRPSMIVGTSTR